MWGPYRHKRILFLYCGYQSHTFYFAFSGHSIISIYILWEVVCSSRLVCGRGFCGLVHHLWGCVRFIIYASWLLSFGFMFRRSHIPSGDIPIYNRLLLLLLLLVPSCLNLLLLVIWKLNQVECDLCLWRPQVPSNLTLIWKYKWIDEIWGDGSEQEGQNNWSCPNKVLSRGTT